MEPYPSPTSHVSPSRLLPKNLGTQYRQLLSLTITRQLLDPCLDDWPPTGEEMEDHFIRWEISDRRIAREHMRAAVRCLGISWGKIILAHILCIQRICADRESVAEFCQDVEKMDREEHILNSTRYEGCTRTGLEQQEDVSKKPDEDLPRGTDTVPLDQALDMHRDQVLRTMEAQIRELGQLSKLRRGKTAKIAPRRTGG
ncbi:hypothetical protein K504DRAFT_14947 [Pleomassaria siparia CBS 279.74]|uniref:Uncharacterized protein n=1 Tax=Pleomassaria siparia CBS 279.74 TaxID=1314801 RepID=A0A6G1KPY5_9PLEO|nr:hypothetical protein K504DRAFT_14947 [Pleomassaria siparia CBS 279.74]